MSGKVLWVTGGGRGIGAATCRLAARQGYSVAVNYLDNAAAADSVVTEIARAGGRAVAIRADASREADVERLFAETEAPRPSGSRRGMAARAAPSSTSPRVPPPSAAPANGCGTPPPRRLSTR